MSFAVIAIADEAVVDVFSRPTREEAVKLAVELLTESAAEANCEQPDEIPAKMRSEEGQAYARTAEESIRRAGYYEDDGYAVHVHAITE